jgi:hypothetical protein
MGWDWASTTMKNNKEPQLKVSKKMPDGADVYVLHYDTFDISTGKLLGATYMHGTLFELIFKLVTAHREALFLGARAGRKIESLEQALKQSSNQQVTSELVARFREQDQLQDTAAGATELIKQQTV